MRKLFDQPASYAIAGFIAAPCLGAVYVWNAVPDNWIALLAWLLLCWLSFLAGAKMREDRALDRVQASEQVILSMRVPSALFYLAVSLAQSAAYSALLLKSLPDAFLLTALLFLCWVTGISFSISRCECVDRNLAFWNALRGKVEIQFSLVC
ncbi:MAG: hypothetical protein RMK45_03595 [Armatimonadota bacterium]|nr:hypothetical protein [Armatimonadota bacterium]